MLWINLEYPEVQKYHAVEFSPTRYIDYVEKFDLSILDEPTLFIMPRMTVDDITMMQYLFAKITDSHPFKELNQKTLVQNKRFNNIYFVYHKAKRNNIEDDIERYKIKRFISMLEFAQ